MLNSSPPCFYGKVRTNQRENGRKKSTREQVLGPKQTERLLQENFLSFNLRSTSVRYKDESGGEAREDPLVTVKSSQKIFTDAEVARLTGICVEHVHNFARSRHLGIIARAAEAAGNQAERWLFTLSDLMVLVTLFPRCTH